MSAKQRLIMAALACVAAPIASASSEGGPTEAAKDYSPYAQSTMPRNVYWGDSHLHTGLSLDAGLFGNTLRPDDGLRFARGEEIVASTGIPVRLARPLDWLTTRT